MPDLSGLSFTGAPETHTFAALLFDMDGTIIDSTPAIEKYWAGVGAEIGVDPATILATSHGRRSIEVLQLLAPHLATWDYVREKEGQVPLRHGSDAIAVPGARSLLSALESARAPWAIVTSGTQPLVQGWINVMGLSQPRFLVTAEEVEHGKPHPAPYLLGAERLGLSPEGRKDVLVLEDAPSGVRAGKAAGFSVVAVATSHSVRELKEAGADWIVRDLESVRMVRFDGEEKVVGIEIRDALMG